MGRLYDNDGDQDLFVANFSEGDLLFKNFLIESGSAVFLDVTSSTNFINSSVGRSQSAAWGDFNNDGFVDLYVCKFWGENALYQNNGGTSFTLLDGVFADVRDSEWADGIDYDDDGDVDLYVVNREQENRLYQNDDGEFSLVFSRLSDTQYGRYSVWADYDNNNLLDLFLGNIGSNSLYKQDPAGTFTNSAAAAGVQSAPDAWDTRGATWGDYDGDGDPDLLYVSGFDEIAPTEGFDGTQGNILFENDNGTFSYRTTESNILRGALNFSTSDEVGSFASSVAFADYDNDGDPDISITNTHQNLLFKNLNPVNDYLKIRVQGKGFGFNNRNGLGSKVRVFNANALSVVVAMQEVGSGPEPQIEHFGLDEGETYIIEVTFLKNGSSAPQTVTVPNITVPLDAVIIQP